MINKNALFIIGSPKKKQSLSFSIANYIFNKLKEADYQCDILFAHGIFNKKHMDNTLNLFNKSDLVIFTYPLYVDSVPAPCIKLLQYITTNRKKIKVEKDTSFLAIGNCGFYEKEQINNSLKSCYFFAKENNLNYLGGIAIGGGPLYYKGLSKNIEKALDITVCKIMDNKELPIDTIHDLIIPTPSKKSYCFFGNIRFLLQSLKNGNLFSLNKKPYIK